MTANRVQPWLDDGDVQLYHGDALDVLRELPAGIAQTCVTSPPYWGLRDYGTAAWEGGDPECDHQPPPAKERKFTNGRGEGSGDDYAGSNLRSWTTRDGTPRSCRCGAKRVDSQLGLEPTPTEYVTNMVALFREVRRVLRDDGTLWLNLGDSYNGSSVYESNRRNAALDRSVSSRQRPALADRPAVSAPGLKPKDLVGIPWRVAFALQADGWYLRSDIIWSKPNPMPESVSDRPTKAHEYVFLFSKQPRYFYDADAIREPHSTPIELQEARVAAAKASKTARVANGDSNALEKWSIEKEEGSRINPAGRNRRSVWTIPTEPFPDAHFATYPQALVQPCVLAGTSERGECVECGAPWQRQATRTLEGGHDTPNSRPFVHDADGSAAAGSYAGGSHVSGSYRVETTGWLPSCRCLENPVPQLVLDPFIGSGTTALVARKHGRRCIGIDLSSEYLAIAAKRTQQLSLLGTV